MNKFKLVPYLVLTKEDAQLETMQEELTKLLNDKTIDDSSKRALYEDLLNKITRFKEAIARTNSVRFQMATAPLAARPTTTASSQTERDTDMGEEADNEEEENEYNMSYDDADHGSTQSADTVSPVLQQHPPPTRQRSVPLRSAAPTRGREQNMDDSIGHNDDYNGNDGQFEMASPSGRHGRRVRQQRRQAQLREEFEHLSPSTTRGGTDYYNPELTGNRKLGQKRTWNHAAHPQPWKN